MPHLLPVFRAARLVGVTRSTLQKKIQDGELTTFEGKVAMHDLLRAFPQTEVGFDAEYERIQQIKSTAFAKRVRERILPSATVLAQRVAELGLDLAISRQCVKQQQHLLTGLRDRLTTLQETPTKSDITAIMQWLDNGLRAMAGSGEAAENRLSQLQAQDTILRVMAAHIRIQPSNHEYWLEGNDTLLDAGVRAGLALNYGCTGGNCGLCKARVISGEVKKIHHHDYVLSEAEKNMNYVLMCACTAVSDVTLEALEASDENDIPQQEIVTKVKSLDTSHGDIAVLHLQTPRSQRLRFLAGQSVKLAATSGGSVELPIASCPCDDRNIIFHVSRKDSPPQATQLLSNVRKGDEITVIGPNGHFLFQEDSRRAPIFLAYGIGFAPIKSLIEHAMALEVAATMRLYWAVDNEDALYAHNLCRSWDDALEEFTYHPLVGADAVAQLLADTADLAACDVYLAAPQEDVAAASAQLLGAGLPEAQLVTLSL